MRCAMGVLSIRGLVIKDKCLYFANPNLSVVVANC